MVRVGMAMGYKFPGFITAPRHYNDRLVLHPSCITGSVTSASRLRDMSAFGALAMG